jgi:hypothetical protein
MNEPISHWNERDSKVWNHMIEGKFLELIYTIYQQDIYLFFSCTFHKNFSYSLDTP